MIQHISENNCFAYEKKKENQQFHNELKGSMDYLHHFHAMGNSHYNTIAKAIENGRGRVFSDSPCGQWKIYFVKY